jgi:hypothetical protein
MTLNDNFTKQEKMLLKEKDNSAKEPSEDIATCILDDGSFRFAELIHQFSYL